MSNTKSTRGITLSVCIDNNNLQTGLRERGRKIDNRSRLTNATLLIRYRNDTCRSGYTKLRLLKELSILEIPRNLVRKWGIAGHKTQAFLTRQ